MILSPSLFAFVVSTHFFSFAMCVIVSRFYVLHKQVPEGTTMRPRCWTVKTTKIGVTHTFIFQFSVFRLSQSLFFSSFAYMYVYACAHTHVYVDAHISTKKRNFPCQTIYCAPSFGFSFFVVVFVCSLRTCQ